MIDLDRRQPQPFESRRRTHRAYESRQVVPGGAVTVAAEVDAGQNDLAMALRDTPGDLAEHGVGGPATRGAADQRDDAEVARERAAVLNLHERPDTVEPRVRVDAADRSDVAGDE